MPRARRRAAAVTVAALVASLGAVALPSAAQAAEVPAGAQLIDTETVQVGGGSSTGRLYVSESEDASGRLVTVALAVDTPTGSCTSDVGTRRVSASDGIRWVSMRWTGAEVLSADDAGGTVFRGTDQSADWGPPHTMDLVEVPQYEYEGVWYSQKEVYTWTDFASGTVFLATYRVPSDAGRLEVSWSPNRYGNVQFGGGCGVSDSSVGSFYIDGLTSPAGFRADPVPGQPGAFWFHPDNVDGDHEWDFGDGSPVDRSFQPVHQYTEPGVYTATHCVTPAGGSRACRTARIEVAAPTLLASLVPVDAAGSPLADGHEFAVDDEVRLRLRVRADSDGVGTITDIQPADGEWISPSAGLEPGEDPGFPDSLELEPGESWQGTATFTVTRAGRVGAGATIVGTDAAGAPAGPVEASWVTRVVGLVVTVETTWPGGGDAGSPPEFQRDNNGDGKVTDEDHILTVTITAENALDEPVTNVRPVNAGEPIDFRNRYLGAVVAMEELPDEDYTQVFGNLAPAGQPGDEASITVKYLAKGDVHADADAIVQGIPASGGLAKGHGTKEVRFGSHLALEAKLDVEERPYWSGQGIRLVGSLTNLLQDRTRADGTTEEAPDLAVVLIPITEGNAGGGYPVPADYGGATPLGTSPLTVAPGETLDIRALLATQQSAESTKAEVRYLVRAWARDPEKPDELATEIDASRIVVAEEDGFSAEHSVRLAPNPFEPDGTADCGTVTTTLQNASCNFVTGLINLGTGLKDLALMVPGGLATTVDAGGRLKLWAMQSLGDSFRALAGDPEAQQRLITEIEVQLETWVNVGIMSREALTAVGGAIADLVREGDRVFSEGDYPAMVAYVSRFLGENPDLGLAAIAKARALAAVARGVAVDRAAMDTAAAIAREANEHAARKAAEEVPQKVRQAVNEGKDPATAGIFRGGENITDLPEVYSGTYGAREIDMKHMYDIAEAEDALIVFRGRSPISQSLIDRLLAWVKPMDVKTKNVNAIDVTYLGFPTDAFGRVELVTPPIDWRLGVKGQEAALEAAADAYMARLKSAGGNAPTFPELADELWADEVRARLIQRTKEFPKERINFQRYADEGIVLEFGYGEQGLRRSLDHGVKETRAAQVTIGRTTDVFGVERQTFQLKMAGPEGTDFRWITGDIDIVGILNADRTPIIDAAKRLRIYESLRELVSMQHGETMTYIHQQVQAKLLRDHKIGPGGSTEGVEGLIVAGPDRNARIGYLDERLSTYEDVLGQTSERSTFQLISGGPTHVLTKVDTGRRAAVASWESTWGALQRTSLFLLPAKWQLFVDGMDADQLSDLFDREAPVIRPDGTGGLEQYSPGADAPSAGPNALGGAVPAAGGAGDPLIEEIIALGLAPEGPLSSSGVGAAGGTWHPVGLRDALALGDPDVLDVAPIAALPQGAAAGDTRIEISTTDELGMSPETPWFRAGDVVVIDPGTAAEEYATVAAIGSLVFEEPLAFAHAPGTTVALVSAAVDGGDGDGDGGDGDGGDGGDGDGGGGDDDGGDGDTASGGGDDGELVESGGDPATTTAALWFAAVAVLAGFVLLRRARRSV